MWSYILDVDLEDDAVERVRAKLVECLEQETGQRPRTRTILSDSLAAALKPQPAFREQHRVFVAEHSARLRKKSGRHDGT